MLAADTSQEWYLSLRYEQDIRRMIMPEAGIDEGVAV